MQSKATDSNRLKQAKSTHTLKGIISPKNASRKKTLSNKDKSQNKKPRRPAHKQMKMESKPYNDEDDGQMVPQREQYYNNQKISDNHNSFLENISEHRQISTKKVDSSQFSNISQCNRTSEKFGTPPKIKLDGLKGVISFEGKMVKNNKKEEEGEHIKNYTRWQTSSREGTIQLRENREKASKSQKKQGKSKSKGKNQKISVGKSKSRPRNIEFHTDYAFDHSTPYKSTATKPQTSNTIKSIKQYESQETFSAPPNLYKYERNEIIDFGLIKQELSQDEKRQHCHKNTIFSMKKIIYEQRCTCINMISKICSTMEYKKQTFGLAVQIFDVYLSDQVLYRKIKVLGLSCLEMALKLQEAQNAYNFMLNINQICEKPLKEPTERKEKEVKTERGDKQLNKSRQKSKKKKPSKKKMDEQLKAAQFHKKKKLFLMIIAQEIPEDEVSRQQMIEFEILIFLKFEFKVWTKTFSYWIDTLTLLWDHFLINQDQSEKSIELILFRCPSNMKNFSFLTQIIEASLYSQQIYDYPKSILVLSAIYMLVRINMEGGSKAGYQNYKKALVKSSNVLFIDRVGCNVLFGTFLLKLEIQMGTILSCCQFISNYLDIEPYCTYQYIQKFGKNTNYDENLSYHFHNPKIYQCYCK